MKICNVKDYETAFNFLLKWLKESYDVVSENMPDADDEVQFAKADGYLTCCSAAIVLAEDMQCKLMQDGDKDNGAQPKRSKKMENRYRDGLQNIYINVCARQRMIVAEADAEEDEKYAAVMRISARAYGIVAELVADELRAADAEVRDGGEDND